MNNVIDINKPVNGNKLAHCAASKRKSFLQIDAFYTTYKDDCMLPDKDGDVLIIGGGTIELMYGANVRVLIPFGADKKVALRQLRKITKRLSKDSDLFSFAEPIQAEANQIPF